MGAGGGGTWQGVINGISWAVNHGDGEGVISMSLGGGTVKSVNEAVKAAADAGMIVVVAAGNSGDDACNYSPASAGGNGESGGTTLLLHHHH